MKTNKFLRFLKTVTVSAAVGLSASTASAVTIDSTRLIGTWDPASAFNSAADATVAAQYLVTWYNGGTNANTADPGSTVFTKAVTGFAPVPSPVTLGVKTDTGGPVNFSGSSVPIYVEGKYGNTAYLFYLGGTGTWTLPSNIAGEQNGLSHYVAFGGGGNFLVPDSGSSVILLGLGLGLLAIVRRKLA